MRVVEFLAYLEVEKRYSEKTIKAYSNDLLQFMDYIQTETGHFDFDTCTLYEVRLWMVSLMTGGYTATSINRKLSALRSYVKYLRKNGLIRKDPLVGIVSPKNKKRLPVFIKPSDLDKLLDEIPFGADYIGIRDRLIIEMLYATGLRVSEITNLRNTQVDLASGSLRIIGKRNKERLVPLSHKLVDLIKDYIKCKEVDFESGGVYFFLTSKGQPVYEKLIYRVVIKYLSLITQQSKKSPHVLRHTFATVLLNNGAELNVIKELLGHSNLSATEVYTHSTFKDLTKAYKLAHPRA